MEKEMHGNIQIDAPADVVWEVLAHRFGDIAEWASIMKSSKGIIDDASPLDAPVSARVCKAKGFGEVREELRDYDEQNMRFRYEAVKGLPFFIKYAENNWSVKALTEGRSEVTCRGVLRMGWFAGTFLFPLFNAQMQKVGDRLFQDLKAFVEKKATAETT